MKKLLLVTAMAVAIALTVTSRAGADEREPDNNSFRMTVSAGAAACLPTNAFARVTISDRGLVQNMHIETFHLPASTEFALFVIQVPNSPFGLSWYQGDIRTNANGHGVGDVAGIFSRETFIVAPNVAPAPLVFPDNAATNPATRPVQIYHLGLWFADPADAVRAGCAGNVTPFDGDHQAGIQVLNTGSFPDGQGPLFNLQ